LNGQITGTATISSATTSTFADAGLLDNEAIVTPITCNGNGSIAINEPREGIDFKWYKLEDDGTAGFISANQSVTNLIVGTYEVRIFDGCKTTTHKFFITDQILTKPVIISPTPQCNQTSFVFSASVLRGKGAITYSWYDAAGVLRGSGSTIALPAGTYTVKVTDEAGCIESATAPPIAARPAPTINLINMSKSPGVQCGSSDGYIRNIVVTPAVGIATYKWFKIVTGLPNEEVGQSLNLENIPGGNYILQVTDQSTCSPILSSTISITTTNSVIISNTAPKSTTCNGTNGKIENISVSDANYYEFSNAIGIIQQGNFTIPTLSFTDLAPGNYTLFAKNLITGCSNIRSFTVNATPVTVYTAAGNHVDATCNLNNGSIKLNYSSQVPSNFVWKNAQDVVITGGTALEIKNLAPGKYTFQAFDNNGCPSPAMIFDIINTPLLTIIPNSGTPFNDGCGLKKGSITGVQVTGGVKDYKYEWLDRNNVIVQTTEKLIDVGAGEYRLRVFDQTSCGVAISEVYTIADIPFEVSTPIAQDVRVCYATDILITVKNKEEGKYQLFKDDTALGPILESETGTFAVKVKKTGQYFLKHIIGTCESTVSSFTVEVINDNLEISNTMTPNGDGINDTWVVKGLPDYKNTLIQLFNRSGQLVYENRGNYDSPFDGMFRGAMLPAGVYYYNVDLKADCKPIAGSLTLLR
jgi:gliding motility-associated-like protein